MAHRDNENRGKLEAVAPIAEWLDVSPWTVRRWCREEGMPHYRTPGGDIRFDRREVREWMRGRAA